MQEREREREPQKIDSTILAAVGIWYSRYIVGISRPSMGKENK